MRPRTLALPILGWLFLACGDSTSEVPKCVPGEQAECACGEGQSGFQVCSEEGTYGACVCDVGQGGGGGEAAGGQAPGGAGGGGGGAGGSGGAGDSCSPDVDLLFLVDDSNSMAEEQAALAAQIPRIVGRLTTGDVDGDGVPDVAAARSVNVGVVTTDLGVGGAGVPTCSDPQGEDGVLLTTGASTAECDPTYDPPLLLELPGGDAASFAMDLSCLVRAGIMGCGFERPLDATLKALSPASATPWTADGYVPPTFEQGSLGHALGANAGMVRPDSVLAIVILTDEEDCSAADVGIFDPSSAQYPGDLNLRCFNYPEALQPTSRFIDGLAALRRDPAHLVVSVIAGVPLDLGGTTAADYDDILADDRMQEVIDPAMPNRLIPSCDVPGVGVAYPPRRIVQTARGLAIAGARTSVGSICQEELTAPVDALLENIAASLATCQPR